MKRFAWMGLIAVFVLAAGSVFAQAVLRPVAQPNAYGATHALTLRYSDLSASTATNTAAVITNTIPAGTVLAFRGMFLNQPFTDGKTTTTNTVQAKLGYGGSDAYFMANTEMAKDGNTSPVFASLGVLASSTSVARLTAVTPTFQVVTNIVGLTLQKDGANVTNVVATTAEQTNVSSAGAIPYRYSSAGQLLLTVTPNAALKLSDLVRGSVTFYFLSLP